MKYFGFLQYIGIVVVLFLFSLNSFNRSSEKLLWFDEAHEINATCALSAYDLVLAENVGQCSLSPFYYLVQKFFLHFTLFDGAVRAPENLPVYYRLVSLFSGIGLLVFLCFSGRTLILPFFLPLLILTFLNQDIFHLYAIENRPYMLWLFLYVFCLFLGLSTIDSPKKATQIFFLLGGGLLTWVAAPGVLQFISIVIPVLILRTKSFDGKKIFQDSFTLILMTFFFLCVGLFYHFSSHCRGIDAPRFDLLLHLQRGDLHLLKNVLRLYLPKGDYFLNALTVVGIFLSFFYSFNVFKNFWKKNQVASNIEFSQKLGLILFFQLQCFLVIAVMVAINHYYFVQRIFIFILAQRALLVLLTADVLVLQLPKKYINSVLIVLSVSMVVWSGLNSQPDVFDSMGISGIRYKEQEKSCPPIYNETKLLVPPGTNFTSQTNLAIYFGKLWEKCASQSIPTDGTISILLKYKRDQWSWEVASDSKIAPLKQMNRSIRFVID